MTITAVIPTIGRPEYFDQSLGSILDQDIPFDQIVVFDNSGKESVRRSSVYANDPRVEWHVSSAMLPPLQSWNTAVSFSKCEYTTICGDDDIFHRTFSHAALESLGKGRLVYVPFSMIDEEGKVLQDTAPESGTHTSNGFRFSRMRRHLYLMIPGMVFKTTDYLSAGGFIDSKMPKFLYSDDLLWFRLSQIAGNVVFCDNAHWSYRVHSAQIGRGFSLKEFSSGLKKYTAILEESLRGLGASSREIYPPELGKSGYIWKLLAERARIINDQCGKPAKGSSLVFAMNSHRWILYSIRSVLLRITGKIRQLKYRLTN